MTNLSSGCSHIASGRLRLSSNCQFRNSMCLAAIFTVIFCVVAVVINPFLAHGCPRVVHVCDANFACLGECLEIQCPHSSIAYTLQLMNNYLQISFYVPIVTGSLPVLRSLSRWITRCESGHLHPCSHRHGITGTGHFF
jgi:hypothetical protein